MLATDVDASLGALGIPDGAEELLRAICQPLDEDDHRNNDVDMDDTTGIEHIVGAAQEDVADRSAVDEHPPSRECRRSA